MDRAIGGRAVLFSSNSLEKWNTTMRREMKIRKKKRKGERAALIKKKRAEGRQDKTRQGQRRTFIERAFGGFASKLAVVFSLKCLQ